MTSEAIPGYISPEGYLETERTSEFRSEYIAGEVLPLPLATLSHGTITANVTGALGNQLRRHSCWPSVGMSVAAPSAFLIPDLLVRCEGARFTDQDEVLHDPIVIVEVLSKPSFGYDHGRKWTLYQQIASLSHYVMIHQDQPCLHIFSRKIGGGWHYDTVWGLDAVVALPAIDCRLVLAEIYERVVFASPDATE